MSSLKILLKGGKKLIKLYRGENKMHESVRKAGGSSSKTFGRFYNPDKEYVKAFASGKKGERTLKTVNVSEKDYNIGRKIEKKLYPGGSCQGTDCNVILPKKNLKDVKTRKFNKGGWANKYYKGML